MTSCRAVKIALLGAWIIAGLLWLGPASFSQNPPPSNKTTPAPANYNPDDYVGQDVCKVCHAEKFTNFSHTAHAKLALLPDRTAADRGCEACHGPGRAHVNAAGDKTKIRSFKGESAKELSEACLRCHAGKEEHNNYRRGEHWRNDVGCTSCHDPHPAAAAAQRMLVRREPQLCLTCHGEIKAQFAKPFHHRVPEGAMKCSDCHNPHGGFELKQVRQTTGADGPCLKCHTNLQGPFTFEHPPVKVEGCTICHTPHGASNPKLLRRNQVRQLCLECHSNVGNTVAPTTPVFHNLADVRFQNCTTCHVKIHGSNTDHYFLR